MARPRKSTVDEYIDQFDKWDVDTQERVMDQLQLVQRLTKKRAARERDDSQAQLPIETEQPEMNS